MFISKSAVSLVAAFLFLVATASAQNYVCTFVSFPIPGSGSYGPVGEGITKNDTMVGSYQDVSGRTHAFRRRERGDIEKRQVHGFDTWFHDINDSGVIVGQYTLPGGSSKGFRISGGSTTLIDYPGADGDRALGISNLGDIAGSYDLGSQHNGFLKTSSGFTSLQVAGALNTAAYDVNDSGTVVGEYTNPDLTTHGFTYVQGTYSTIDYPGQSYTVLDAINDSGAVVGYYFDNAGLSHGFIYANGTFRSVMIPNSDSTTVNAINQVGDIAGMSTSGGQTTGYLGMNCQ